jgi:hypothetical protein
MPDPLGRHLPRERLSSLRLYRVIGRNAGSYNSGHRARGRLGGADAHYEQLIRADQGDPLATTVAACG